jgi:hypothetical protein
MIRIAYFFHQLNLSSIPKQLSNFDWALGNKAPERDGIRSIKNEYNKNQPYRNYATEMTIIEISFS